MKAVVDISHHQRIVSTAPSISQAEKNIFIFNTFWIKDEEYTLFIAKLSQAPAPAQLAGFS